MLITWDEDYEVKAGAGELQGHGTTSQQGLNQFTKDLQNKRSFQPAFNKEKIIVADFWCSGREGHHGHEQSAHVFSLVINPGVFINFLLPGSCLAAAGAGLMELLQRQFATFVVGRAEDCHKATACKYLYYPL